ncbi:MAG TPA: hypothetical protein VEX43_17610 [Chthoniobacterales bacterium]|nr:hypothetical protein [Chthoniobacterales bacterium]
MNFYNKSEREFTRPHQEEIDMVFSGIDCVLNDERAIYCSCELTTGARLYAALREHKVKTAPELKEKLGKEWFSAKIFDANVKLGKEFAQCVRNRLTDKTLVITPGPFMAPTWTQPEYLFFWETLLRTRIKAGCFNRNWQFSNGCTFEFTVAVDEGLPTLDHNGEPLDLESGIQLIETATRELESDGFDTSTLRQNLERLHAIQSRTGALSPA